jgi:ribosome-associated protein
VTTSRQASDPQQIREWVLLAAQAADDKKAIDPVVLEVGELLAITDYFVIASAPNDRLVETLAEEVERQVKEAGGPAPIRIEGLSDRQWVLMDYGDFVVHLFLEDVRRFYDLERLWVDAPRVEWRDGSREQAVAGG